MSKCWWRGVARKWLNIQSGANQFNSDYNLQSSIGSICNCRSKSCSHQDCYFNLVVPNNLTEGVDDPLKLRMFVGTWNVGGKAPYQNQGFSLKEWLLSSPAPSTPPHIYVLGFQEIVALNAGNVLGAEDNSPVLKWLSLIRQTLNNDDDIDKSISMTSRNRMRLSELVSLEDDDQCFFPQQQYRLVASKQMVGIFLCVWVRSDIFPLITNLKVSCVGRGIMGYLGNKGSVSISMALNNTTFCFVCTHLSSGEKEGDEIRRNMDVLEILKRTRFSHSCKPSSTADSGQPPPPRSIFDHDKVIWLGDLNYRLVDSNSVSDTHELIKKNDWKALLEKDQLRIEQSAGRVFHGWEEGNIDFAPTYKYLDNSDDYYVSKNSKSRHKQRTPAWCDRILWRGEGMKQEWYVRGDSKFSDHRPVSSLFQLQLHFDYDCCNNNNNNVIVDHKSNALSMGMGMGMGMPIGLAKVQAEEVLEVLVVNNMRREVNPHCRQS